MPSFQALPLKILHVINDDTNVLDENIPVYNEDGEVYTMSQLTNNEEANQKIETLKQKYHSNNGQVLYTYQ